MNVEQRERYFDDIAAHKPAEAIAIEVLSDLGMGFNFTDVSSDSKYYNKGDAIMSKDGVDKFVDIKDDGCVWKTNNFFIETGGWDKIHNCKCKGWINSDYDFLAIVSQEKKNIWLLSMNRIKKFYNKFNITGGRKVESQHWDKRKWGVTLPIEAAVKLNIVLAKIKYDYDDMLEYYFVKEYIGRRKLQNTNLTEILA